MYDLFPQFMHIYRILMVIRSAIIYIRSKTNGGGGWGCASKIPIELHWTAYNVMRDALKKGMRYKQDVHIPPRK